MKSFNEYVKLREDEDNQDDDSINPVDSGDGSALFRMIRLAWKSHNNETKSFFRKLAAIDPEIAGEYQRIDDSDLELPRKIKDSDKDEIRPPSSDTGPGLNDDQGD